MISHLVLSYNLFHVVVAITASTLLYHSLNFVPPEKVGNLDGEKWHSRLWSKALMPSPSCDKRCPSAEFSDGTDGIDDIEDDARVGTTVTSVGMWLVEPLSKIPTFV